MPGGRASSGLIRGRDAWGPGFVHLYWGGKDDGTEVLPMRLHLLLAWALAALAESQPAMPAPLAWSPNGRWIAAVGVVPDEAPPVVGSGFLFGEELAAQAVPAGRPGTYRLAAIQVEDGAAVRLAGGPLPF